MGRAALIALGFYTLPVPSRRTSLGGEMFARLSISSSMLTVRLLSIIYMGVRSDRFLRSFEPELCCWRTCTIGFSGDRMLLLFIAANYILLLVSSVTGM